MNNDIVYVLAIPDGGAGLRGTGTVYVADTCLVVNLKVAMAFRDKQDAMNYESERGFSWDHGWEVTPVPVQAIGPRGTIV